MDLVRLAYDVVQDEWDLPDIDYLNNLDASDMSRKMLEDVAKEAGRKLLGHFATKASVRLLDMLMHQLEKLPLPDCNGKSQAMVTEVDYEATNSRVQRTQAANSKVTIEGSKVRWSVSEVGLESVGEWTYKMIGGLVSDKGTYELSMAGMGFDFEADIVKIPGGVYDLEMGGCELRKGLPDLQVGGSPGCMLFQCLFQNAILPSLKEQLPEQVASALKDVAFNIAPFLKQFHAYWPLAMGVIEVSSDLINSLVKGV